MATVRAIIQGVGRSQFLVEDNDSAAAFCVQLAREVDRLFLSADGRIRRDATSRKMDLAEEIENMIDRFEAANVVDMPERLRQHLDEIIEWCRN